jgi:hypothetical protein
MGRTALLAALLAAAWLTGCSLTPEQGGAAGERTNSLSRNLREREMNLRWQDHRMSELRASLGAPVAMLDIPGGGNPPGFVLVYPRDAATGCLDAFALVYGRDPVIRTYQCR